MSAAGRSCYSDPEFLTPNSDPEFPLRHAPIFKSDLEWSRLPAWSRRGIWLIRGPGAALPWMPPLAARPRRHVLVVFLEVPLDRAHPIGYIGETDHGQIPRVCQRVQGCCLHFHGEAPAIAHGVDRRLRLAERRLSGPARAASEFRGRVPGRYTDPWARAWDELAFRRNRLKPGSSQDRRRPAGARRATALRRRLVDWEIGVGHARRGVRQFQGQ